MIDYAGMRRSLLASFGEQVTVVVGGLDRPLTAAYLAPYTGVDVGGVQVNRPDPQFIANTADWEATAAQTNDVIVRADGIEYVVVDPQPADDGMTVIAARRYS